MTKGKDHKAYEYGSKASIASTANSNVIVGQPREEYALQLYLARDAD